MCNAEDRARREALEALRRGVIEEAEAIVERKLAHPAVVRGGFGAADREALFGFWLQRVLWGRLERYALRYGALPPENP